MAETRQNLIVGLFMLVGLAALAVLVVLFGSGPTWLMQGQSYPLHIRFDEVAGIRPGNLVTIRGITIGRVLDVDLFDPDTLDAGVDVTVSIDREYRIPAGSRARTTEPVLGQGRPPIEIVAAAPSGEWLEAGATLDGSIRSAMDSIFPPGVVSTFQTTARQIGDAAEALTPVLEEMEQLLAQRSPTDVDSPGGLQGNLSTVVARFDGTLKHFNDVLGDPAVKSELRDAVANLHSMSEQGVKVMNELDGAATGVNEFVADGRRLVERADATLVNLDTRLTTLAEQSAGSLGRMDSVLDNLSVVTRQMAAGEGTVGRMLMDDKLYEALLISSERLALMVQDFRALIAEWREGKIRVAL